MTKREIVRRTLEWKRPLYVPWNIGLTHEARQMLRSHFGTEQALEAKLNNHFATFGSGVGYFTDVGDDRVRDHFGVIWDRSYDKDIGSVEGLVLPDASLHDLTLPDPDDRVLYEGMETAVDSDLFCVFAIGFSLFERAWTLRGMENLLVDFIENPTFVHDLFTSIADYNIAVATKAASFGVDAVYFGDDWGQQSGLIMGPMIWREFIKPQLERMYGAVRDTGKFVFIHSCGDVEEVFDDLVELGVSCFNPFQPEVMDIHRVFTRYTGELAFHGGLSTQRTLPFGTPQEVRDETRRLLDMGRDGGYVFSAAHAVEGDVPLDNLLVVLDELNRQVAGNE